MTIETLNPEVVNQIAAGEVVERPAHLIKELVENSLDAGATELEVELGQGGRHVRVRDNGQGIQMSDLPKALARHATSKIQAANDLWKLNTYGFRGEALASISAVSDMTLISRTKADKTAYELKSHYGELVAPVPVGGEQGTSVWVKELFANLPARLKFLRSDQAEITQIKNVLKAMALASPQVSIRIRNKGKLLHFWPAKTDPIGRVEQVLNCKPLYYSEGEENGFKVKAAFSAPHQVTGSRSQIWIFVRGRWVADKGLTAAVMEAYRQLLMHGEYPITAVWVDCPPDEVDVNIHPTKSQIKFRKPSQAFHAVVHVLRQGLEKAPWLESILKDEEVYKSHQTVKNIKNSGPELATLKFSEEALNRTQYQKKTSPSFSQVKQRQVDMAFVPSKEEKKTKPDKVLGKWSSLQVLGQAHLTYIIAQSSEALVFVDQHAAHERVAFEELMQAWNEGQVEVQNFLLPLTMSMSADQVEVLMGQCHELEKLGLIVEQLGPESVAVRSAPVLLKEAAIEKALHWLTEEIVDKGGSFALERTIANLCATMACHSVIRAGQALSIEQMQSLLEEMDRFPLSSFCPHGRPVFVEYPFQKLERDFGRLV